MLPWIGWEPLRPEHGIEAISVGLESADVWLSKCQAEHNNGRTTTVVFPDANGVPCGFFSTKLTTVYKEKKGELQTEGSEVASHLLWLGVRNDLQGQGFGKRILTDYLKYSVNLAPHNPFRYIVLDVAEGTKTHVRAMYQKVGFSAPGTHPTRMQMKVSTARKQVQLLDQNGYAFTPPIPTVFPATLATPPF